MDKITQAITERRALLTIALQRATAAKEALSLAEAQLYMDCHYKGLGRNETERKAAFEILKHQRLAVQLAELREAEQRKQEASDALDEAQDVRRAYENALRGAFLAERYNVNVSIADFEAMLAEPNF